MNQIEVIKLIVCEIFMREDVVRRDDSNMLKCFGIAKIATEIPNSMVERMKDKALSRNLS